ncbi:MAG: DNA polymerase I [Deltaproteobacteria bacterium RBG_13_52_11]|nr:MAG: DNA polymerase I [Deltaproteobacteria bacterium RBG_13_52_11]
MPPLKKFFLIDGSSYIFRAFFAIRGLSTAKGIPTNAAFGFTSMLLKVLRDHKPDGVAVVFDTKKPTFRHKLYADYKANRPTMPDDLAAQIPYIKKIVEGFRIPALEKEGYEADDLIGTIAKKAEKDGIEVVIVSGDKDLLQLVSEKVTLLDTMKDAHKGLREVKERFGVIPGRIPDILGLAGDSIDNIPGVPGIGEKTAVDLIKRFGSLDSLLQRLEGLDEKELKKKTKENIRTHRDQALLSRDLATIDTNIPLEIRWDDFLLSAPDEEGLRATFKELEFHKFIQELVPHKSISYEAYHLITTEEELAQLVAGLKGSEVFSVDLETTSRDPITAKVVGLSFSHKPHEAYYCPVAHDYPGVPSQLPPLLVLEQLRSILEDAQKGKYGQNIKYDYLVLRRHGLKMAGITCDTMVASYLLNPTKRSHSLENIAQEYLEHQMITYKEVTEKGQGFQKVDLQQAMKYSCEDADVTFLLAELLMHKLEEEGLKDLFFQMELPLVEVLAEMELWGVKINPDLLLELSKELETRLWALEKRVFDLVGEEFNINSTQQLGKILFEKLRLPVIKQTKTGYSTDVAVLEELANEHELPRTVLEYRSFTKLKSTYTDALPKLIEPSTGRVHTSYNQTVTATGRLSSSDPNLQNIPIRTEEGRRIREAFVPEDGWWMISADYSQIELRILAHLSKDTTLIKTFQGGEDIHTRTASEIFGIPQNEVTPQMRREAKVINFGIIYGMSPYGLAKELGVEPKVAAEYIEEYFRRYQGVKSYIDGTLKEAKKKGYVTTLYNRRRYLPEINSSNRTARQFAERTAINTPIQGTAADLIKIAMIRIYRCIKVEGLKAKMIMQVHDELVLEVPDDEVERAERMVKEEMEGVLDMVVPLKVSVERGRNWGQIH